MNESKDRAALRTLLEVFADAMYFSAEDFNAEKNAAVIQANAALAQPDPVPALVEALRELADQYEAELRNVYVDDMPECMVKARAAIKAATGE